MDLRIIAVIVSIIIIIILYFMFESLVSYGRPIGSFYSINKQPQPDWIATDHNYGYICKLGGGCQLAKGGLLTKEQCEKDCHTSHINWTPPWKEIDSIPTIYSV